MVGRALAGGEEVAGGGPENPAADVAALATIGTGAAAGGFAAGALYQTALMQAQLKDELDAGRMRDAASRFVGRHDFRSFSDDEPGEKSTEVVVETLELHEDGDLILVHVEGSHFIWKMVRRLVGVLVEVGRGGLAPGDMPALLASRSELPAKLTAPASGLFLERVFYTGDGRDTPLRPATPDPLRQLSRSSGWRPG